MDNHKTSEPVNDQPDADPIVLDDSQLSPRDWLMRNGIFLLFVAGLSVFLFQKFGVEGMWAIVKAALGLSFVIFIHELGHFAVAKWCDVHVETFSIGFGPALPGCSFTRGETTYKIALIPLGGYVKMVGEGETEGHEDNPRSFHNKPVGQRMAIISAGVIMNVILGCICFIIVYYNGVKQPTAAIGRVDPGSPAWQQGVPTGVETLKIGNTDKPYFEGLKHEVMLSGWGQKLLLVVQWPDGRTETFEIEPRRGKHDSQPVIGVMFPPQLKLPPAKEARKENIPLAIGPAATARQVDLKPGDVIVATAAAEAAEPEPLPENSQSPHYGFELAKRFKDLQDKTLFLYVRRNGADPKAEPERIKLPAEENGFHYDDLIVGTTDAGADNKPYSPYRVKPLPHKDLPDDQGPRYDYFEYNRRMQDLAGKPVIIQVLRSKAGASDAPVSLLVPPAFHYTFGLRMKMGPITAIRAKSGADKADLKPGDQVEQVEASDGKGGTVRYVLSRSEEVPQGVTEKLLDPLRLPQELRQLARDRKNFEVKFTLKRDDKLLTVAVPWDRSWQYNLEKPITPQSPLSIPELGLAYRVETAVAGVEADQTNLKEGDIILAVRFKDRTDGGKFGELKWGPWHELYTEDSAALNEKQPEPWWAQVLLGLQSLEDKTVELKIRRGTQDLDPLTVTMQPDPTWPLQERGLHFLPDWRLQKAHSPLEAVEMGVVHTKRTIIRIYMGLRNIITGRLPATKNLRGPIDIGKTAYDIAGVDFNTFLLFLGLISVNLAVINFLPIPVLDGGHMVFLIYEKLRGKPASEKVRLAVTYVGLAFLGSLMLFVVWLDVKRHIL